MIRRSVTVVLLTLAGLFALLLGAQLSGLARAADGEHDVYLPILLRPATGDQDFYINHYTPIYVSDISTRVLTNVPRLPFRKTVIHTAEVGNVSVEPADWDVGDFTGFYPTGDLTKTQRGIVGGRYGSTAMQMEGFTMGFFIQSKPPNVEFPYQLAQFFYGFSPRIYPWSYGPNARLCVDHEAAVPYSNYEDGSINITYAALLLKDESTNTRLWLSMSHYDQRPDVIAKGDVPHWWPEAEEPIAYGMYGGNRYSSLQPGSAVSTAETWDEWRYFGFCVSREQLLAAIDDTNRLFDFGLSDDLDSYSIMTLGIGPELYIEGDATGEMAMRLRDVRVYTLLDSE